jgi:RimJ/RimL family protein N-acetyltransferase
VPSLVRPDPPLTDGVVLLRAVRESDVQAIVEACRDPGIKRFTSSVPDPYSEDDALAWLRTHREDEVAGIEMNFAIADADDEEVLCGVTGLHAVDWKSRRGATGYWIAPWARRAGRASRATELVARWALEEVGLVRVELLADVENPASQRVAERAGFVREGVLRRHTVMGGASRDCVIFGRIAG